MRRWRSIESAGTGEEARESSFYDKASLEFTSHTTEAEQLRRLTPGARPWTKNGVSGFDGTKHRAYRSMRRTKYS